MSEQSPGEEREAPPAVVDDTGDMRGYHFRRLMVKPLTLVLGSILIAGLGIGLGGAVSPGAGAGGAVGGLLLVVIVVLAIAGSKAADDFYRVYAQARGLTWNDDRQQLLPATPLLRHGNRRYSENTFEGALPGGMAGTLSLFTYEVDSTDSKGNRQTSYYRFTVGLFGLPEPSNWINKLYCQRKSGFRFMEKAEDAFRKNKRIHLESEAFLDRYELFADEKADDIWVRRVFSPKTIVWMTDTAPKGFAFEFETGMLCVNMKGHKSKAAELDAFCEAASHIADVIRDEAKQGTPPAADAPAQPAAG